MPGACYKPATASALPIATLFAHDALNKYGVHERNPFVWHCHADPNKCVHWRSFWLAVLKITGFIGSPVVNVTSAT